MMTNNKEMFECLDKAFIDEFNLWDVTEGSTIMFKIDNFLNEISKFNVLLFNTKETMKSVQTLLVTDSVTQDGVMLFLLRVKFNFIVAGGDWETFTDTLNQIANSFAKDNSFNDALEGFTDLLDIDNNNMLQALMYYYILSPNIMISRTNHVKEE